MTLLGQITTSAPYARKRLRFSSLAGRLFAHSAFPTAGVDAVFFGPDTYRFARLLEQAAPRRVGRAVDSGCGSGAGGILLASRCAELVLADITPAALALARANLDLNRVAGARTVLSDILAGVDGDFDLVIANPPYGVKVEDAVRKAYFPNDSQSKDTYGLFMARAVQLLCDGGEFSYIVAWLIALGLLIVVIFIGQRTEQ